MLCSRKVVVKHLSRIYICIVVFWVVAYVPEGTHSLHLLLWRKRLYVPVASPHFVYAVRLLQLSLVGLSASVPRLRGSLRPWPLAVPQASTRSKQWREDLTNLMLVLFVYAHETQVNTKLDASFLRRIRNSETVQKLRMTKQQFATLLV
jgi:hypothetical protein